MAENRDCSPMSLEVLCVVPVTDLRACREMGGLASSAMPELFSSQVLSLRTWTLLYGPANLSLNVMSSLLL